jgi:transcriptional regulator GlxA family with amidase domain
MEPQRAARNSPAMDIEAHLKADLSPRSRVRRLVEWILEDPARPRNIEHLADRAAMSPRNLSRVFVQETGTTPARFVEQARIGLARRLLARTGVRVAWVAACAGFESAERMRRAFQRRLATSPRDYASVGSGTMRK